MYPFQVSSWFLKNQLLFQSMNCSLVERGIVLSKLHLKEGVMTRRKTHIEKILALLASGKVRITLVWRLPFGLEDCWGYCDEKNDEEILVKRTLCLNSRILILIHECLHWLYPEKNHSWVIPQTRKIYESLSTTQRERFSFFFDKLENAQQREMLVQKKNEARCRKKLLKKRELRCRVKQGTSKK